MPLGLVCLLLLFRLERLLFDSFLILDDYLITCFILSNYSQFGLSTLIEIVKLLTSKKSITLHELELLNKRIIACPELYATKFFENKNLRQEIDALLEKENTIHFNSPAVECVFCKAKLNENLKQLTVVLSMPSRNKERFTS